MSTSVEVFLLGYRLKPVTDPYATPYTDLPEFVATRAEAFHIHAKLTADFPNAEWRLVQVINRGYRS